MRLKQYILQDSDEVTVATSGSFSTYLPGIQYSIQKRFIRVYDILISMNVDPFDVKIDLFDVIPASKS